MKRARLILIVSGTVLLSAAAISWLQWLKPKVRNRKATVATSAASPTPEVVSPDLPTEDEEDLDTLFFGDEPLHPPGVSAARQDVEADPHGTPNTLVEFAGQLGGRMDEALGSKEKATELFAELEKCVEDPSGNGLDSVRALCLWDASRLAQTHAQLRPSFEALKAKTPQALFELLEASDLR